MKLSIIIPVYNVEQYIFECLNSIYDGNICDFEVICIDDCGTDNSMKLIRSFISKKKIDNIIIKRHDKNKGLSEARNTGIAIAKGQYICFLDSDDMVNAKKLNKLVNVAVSKKLDVLEGSYSEIFETDMNIEVGAKNNNISNKVMDGDEYFSIACFNDSFVPMVWTRIYSRDYLIRNKFKFKTGLKFEDEEFSPRVIISSNKIQYLDEKFYIYRRRENSITTNMVKDNKWVDHYLNIIDSLTNFCETIKAKKSYSFLGDRIAELVLSLYKNPIAYGAKDEYFSDIVKLVNNRKLYRIPMRSHNRTIFLQGILMKFPKLFKFLYRKKAKVS